MNKYIGLVLGAGLLALPLMAIACGGDDSTSSDSTKTTSGSTAAAKGSSEKLVDTGKADDVAHSILLSESDLPGTGWTVTKTDDFSSDSGPDANTAACKDIKSRQDAVKAKTDAGRKGRAEKELSLDGAGPIPLSVESDVNVFGDTAVPADALKAMQDALKSSNWEDCLKDSLGQIGNDVKIDAKVGTAQTSAPSGGSAQAYDFSFSVQGQSFNLHYETYVWRSANVGVTVTVSGMKDEVKADVVKAAVDKTVAKLNAAPKS